MTGNLGRVDSEHMLLLSRDSLPVVYVLLWQQLIVFSFCVHLASLSLTLKAFALLNDIISELIMDYRCLPFVNLMGLNPNSLGLRKIIFIFLWSKFIMKDSFINIGDHVRWLDKWERKAESGDE